MEEVLEAFHTSDTHLVESVKGLNYQRLFGNLTQVIARILSKVSKFTLCVCTITQH